MEVKKAEPRRPQPDFGMRGGYGGGFRGRGGRGGYNDYYGGGRGGGYGSLIYWEA